MKKFLAILLLIVLAFSCVACNSLEEEITPEQSWELSNNPMFQELYTGITTITVSDRATNEVFVQIQDPEAIQKLLYTFNDWSLESAATTPSDLIFSYLVSFDDKLVIEFHESTNDCKIDHKAYTLPEAFHQQIVEYLS